MSKIARGWLVAVVLVATFGLVCRSMAAYKGYYSEQPPFHFYPDPAGLRYTIHRVGPLGFGVELRQPAFTMYVSHIEAGSPAAAAGKLKIGQIVESINGEVLKDIDPRVQLGNLITRIEATDGIARLMVKDSEAGEAYPVEIRIPVRGGYSETWPVDCPKSDRIVREFADFLATQPQGWGAALFLLSTGEDKDLDVVRRWFQNLNPAGTGHPWSIGYTGPAICEYYLRTGDESVLPWG